MPGGVVDGGSAGDDSARRGQHRIAVNRTADRAFVDFVAGASGTGLDATLRAAYTVDARVVAAVAETRSDPRPSLDSPGANWTLSDRRVEMTTRVERATGAPPGVSPGWHLLAYGTRRVVRTHALVGNWTRGNETRQTVQRWTESAVVRVGVAGDHTTVGAEGIAVPPRPIEGVHERGGPLDGPNLRDVSTTATERLIADRGGFDAVARRAVAGILDARPQSIVAQRPTDLRRWTYLDLVALRERVRNVSVEMSRTAVVAEESPPAAVLAAELRSRRAELVDAPARYDGAADRARIAARAAYLDRVIDRLEARADRTNETRTGLDRALADAGVSLDRARRVLRSRATPATPPPEPMATAGPGAPSNLSVAGAPPYLTLAELDHEHVAAIPEGESRYPLAARNRNVFSVPYGDAADAVTSALDGDRGRSRERSRTDLRSAALALRAANRTLEARENETLAERRNALRLEVSASVRAVRRALVAELGAAGFGLAVAERRRAVRAGFARWNTTAGRALAVANGSAADAVAAEIRREHPRFRKLDRRGWLGLRTELALEAARAEDGGASRSAVNRTAQTAREIARNAAADALSNAMENASERARERWFGEVLAATPAGLPVAPVPGYWYATVNVWDVTVRGQYERFTVRAPQGTPDAAGGVGGSVAYTRENATVRADVDGDGDSELLGHTTPISFESETVVVVVVPPGPPGVGDRDGDSDERSPGWSPDK